MKLTSLEDCLFLLPWDPLVSYKTGSGSVHTAEVCVFKSFIKSFMRKMDQQILNQFNLPITLEEEGISEQCK